MVTNGKSWCEEGWRGYIFRAPRGEFEVAFVCWSLWSWIINLKIRRNVRDNSSTKKFSKLLYPKRPIFYASFFVLSSHRSHFKNWANKKEFLNFKHRLFLLSKVMSATYFSCHEGVGEGKEQTCAFSSVRVLEIPNFSKLKSWCRFFPKSLHHSHCTL